MAPLSCTQLQSLRKKKYEMYPTFKEAPNTKEQEGQEEVGGEVVQGGHHDTRGAWIGLNGNVAVGDRGGVVEVVAGR